METEEIPKEIKEVPQDIINVLGIKAREDQATGKINKIEFSCEEGLITWKPKVENTRFQNGLEIVKIEKMDFKQIPQKIMEMLKIIGQNKKVEMKVCYKIMNTFNTEGLPVSYKFITSMKEFDTWEIVKKKK